MPGTDKQLRLTGQAYPDIITVATPATAIAESLDVNAEYIKSFARWYLMNSMSGEDMSEQQRLTIKAAYEDSLLTEKVLSNRPLPNAVPVQVSAAGLKGARCPTLWRPVANSVSNAP